MSLWRVPSRGGTLDAIGDEAFLRLPPKEKVSFICRGGRVTATLATRARIVVMLGRPRTCVPGLLAYALGYSYTGAPSSSRMALGALLALLVGFAANFHNTATDLREDSHNLPGRVLLLAKLGYRPHVHVCRALGLFMMAGALLLGWHFAIFMTLALAGLHQYSAPPFRSKGRPLLGLWVFAQAVVFPFLFGWTTEPGQMLPTLLAAVVAPLRGAEGPSTPAAWQSFRYLAMWGFLTIWFMAKGMFKNVPDFEGDRAAGVRTSATRYMSRRAAARAATVATVFAYAMLAALTASGLEKPTTLYALAWIGPVFANCLRLVRAEDGRLANRVMKIDMLLSTGFIASLLLLIAPTRENVVMVGVALVVLLGSDLLGIDSRRDGDAERQPVLA